MAFEHDMYLNKLHYSIFAVSFAVNDIDVKCSFALCWSYMQIHFQHQIRKAKRQQPDDHKNESE